MDTDTTRAEFEALKLFHAHDYHERVGDEYVNPFVNKAWRAYIAALQSRSTAVQGVMDAVHELIEIQRYAIDYVRKRENNFLVVEAYEKAEALYQQYKAAAPTQPARVPFRTATAEEGHTDTEINGRYYKHPDTHVLVPCPSDPAREAAMAYLDSVLATANAGEPIYCDGIEFFLAGWQAATRQQPDVSVLVNFLKEIADDDNGYENPYWAEARAVLYAFGEKKK